MSDFLDKVAMEVAEWAETLSDRKTWCWAHSNEYDDFIAYLDKDNIVTKDQWAQRRKELINEPCDSDAPEWARWKAQDASGIWHWYKGDKPIASKAQWDVPCGGTVSVATNGKIPAGHDWLETLKEVKRLSEKETEYLKGVATIIKKQGESMQEVENRSDEAKEADMKAFGEAVAQEVKVILSNGTISLDKARNTAEQGLRKEVGIEGSDKDKPDLIMVALAHIEELSHICNESDDEDIKEMIRSAIAYILLINFGVEC